jgi:hypothetical protein
MQEYALPTCRVCRPACTRREEEEPWQAGVSLGGLRYFSSFTNMLYAVLLVGLLHSRACSGQNIMDLF